MSYLNDIVYAGDFVASTNTPAQNRAGFQSAIDAAFGPASNPNATSPWKNRPLIYPHGLWDIDLPLVYTQVQGARIIGAGRGATFIRNQTGAVFKTNGLSYSRMEGFQLSGASAQPCLDVDWDGSAGASLQACTFADILFDATQGAAYGARVAASGFMGSEMSWDNCHFTGATLAGLCSVASNALSHTVTGGNFQSCKCGIWIIGGSLIALGAAFQQQTDYDIRIETSSVNAQHIAGCRSESTNFLYLAGGSNCGVYDIDHQGAVLGIFANWRSGHGEIRGVRSVKGQVVVRDNTRLRIRGSFDRADWLDAGNLWPDLPAPNDQFAGYVDIVGVTSIGSRYQATGNPDWTDREHVQSNGTTGAPVFSNF